MQQSVVLQNQVNQIARDRPHLLIGTRSCLDVGLPLPGEHPAESDRDAAADCSKPEMIESFEVPKNNVAKWTGITAASFSIGQALTGVLWGRASDRWGRKTAILTGVVMAMFSSLMFGFSSSLAMAILARSLAGVTYGNVGTYRTVVAEIVPEKELQPRAFSIMPLVFTMGNIFGPGLGGALVYPAQNFPKTFANSALFERFPYALPNIAASAFFAVALITGTLFLNVR